MTKGKVAVLLGAMSALFLVSCTSTPSEDDANAQPMGIEVTERMANDWYRSIYVSSDCPTPVDPSVSCDDKSLVSSKQILLEEGSTVERYGFSVDGEGASMVRESQDIETATLVWCFKSKWLSIEAQNGEAESNATEQVKYDYNCYRLTDLDDDGALFATYMGTLLPTGEVGVSPEQECKIEFGLLPEESERPQSEVCLKEGTWVSEPSW